MKRFLAGLVFLFASAWAAAGLRAADIRFSLPLECSPGKTCFLQNYVDTDPGGGVSDYRCGTSSYNGHKGTDFRVLSAAVAEKGVPVLASAPGIVKALRDGMDDRLIKGPGERAKAKGRECGNGVVIDHGQGWETQYCHMKRGSIAVTRGQQVERGSVLGLLGYSGQAQFAHIHVSVRHNGDVIDPFTGARTGKAKICGEGEAGALWTPEVLRDFPYIQGQVIQTGFADRPVKLADLETGTHSHNSPRPDSAAFVFYARFINLVRGDVMRLLIEGPDGFEVTSSSKPLDRKKAQHMVFAGKRRRDDPWASGVYRARAQLLRAGNVLVTQHAEFRIP